MPTKIQISSSGETRDEISNSSSSIVQLQLALNVEKKIKYFDNFLKIKF